MVTLATVLAARGVEDFSRYVHRCSPEELYTLVHAGVGADSLRAAAVAWKKLADSLCGLAWAHRNVVSGQLDRLWLSSVGQAMVTMVLRYAQWLRETALYTYNAYSCARDVADAYETASVALTPPAIISSVGALVQELRVGNALGLHATSLAVAESALDIMLTHNINVMTCYARTADIALRQLQLTTPFLAPPVPATGDMDQQLKQIVEMVGEWSDPSAGMDDMNSDGHCRLSDDDDPGLMFPAV